MNRERTDSVPTFSAVIPLYNKERHVERAVRSALDQTVPPLEIVVVDDGSTDGGAEIVERLAAEDGRVRLIRQENGGVSRARNVGISEARGTHVAFLDADDEWKPIYLEEIVRIVEQYPQAGCFCTNFTVIKANGRIRPGIFLTLNPRRRILLRNYFKALFQGSPVWTSATVVPKSTFERSGVFLDGGGRGQDLDLWWRIGAWFDIAYSQRRLANYHMDADNRSDKRKRKPSETSTSGRWWAVDRLETLSKDLTISEVRRRWMGELIRWYDILAAYNRYARGDKDHGLGKALAAAWGGFSFFYTFFRLLPRFLSGR